ncbi:hypothetical protein J6590_074302, partial [Homalodisca vitripennis]
LHKKYRVYGVKTTFKFNPVPENIDEIDWLRTGFSKIVNDMKSNCSDSDYLGFTLHSLNLKSKDPGYVAFRPADQVKDDVLFEIFGGIIQSNSESVKSTDTFRVECTRVNLPVGSGRVRPGFYNNFQEECKTRRGIPNPMPKNCDSFAMSVATSFTVFAMLLLVVAGNDLEEQPSTSNGLRRSQPIPVPGAIRDRYFTTDSGSIVHLNMNNGDDRATLPVLQREVTRNEYEAQIQRMFRSGRWVTTRRGRLHVISAGIEEVITIILFSIRAVLTIDLSANVYLSSMTSTGGGTRQITDTDESQPSTLGWTGDATPNITLPSDISEESLIAAADRAIAEASTFPDEATQRVVMEESNSSSDEAISLSTSWDFRRNPSTRRQSSEDLSQFYRRLNQSTPPTVSPISSGSFHSGFSPDPASQESLISMEVAVGSPPLLSPSADRDPQWEAMRAVSRSLSIVAQVQGIGEGAVYDSERWMVRRPEEEFRAAAPAAWEEIRSILADFLYETATRMEEDSRRRNTAAPSNGSTPATQPREVSCPVCFANLPTIALRLCGHTLCRPCSNRVGDRCPTCRELIVGRFTIYLPR